MKISPRIAAHLHTVAAIVLILSAISGLTMPDLKSDIAEPMVLQIHVWCGLCTLAVFLARIFLNRGLSRAAGPTQQPTDGGEQSARLTTSSAQILVLLAAATGILMLFAASALWLAIPWPDSRMIHWSEGRKASLHILKRLHAGFCYGALILAIVHVCQHYRIIVLCLRRVRDRL